jgi:hypothetical protein
MKTIAAVSGFLGWLLLAPSAIYAAEGWTSYGQVSELTATNQLGYLVTLKNADNPSDCRNKKVFYQNYSSFGSEQMFLLLLEAVRNGKKVRLYVTGNCELNGYSEISSVSLVP